MRRPVRGRQAVLVRKRGVGPVTYQLVIRGGVGDRFAVLFAGMRFTRRDGLTTLTGRVADQAQLLGLVERAQELGSNSSLCNSCPARAAPRRTREFAGVPAARPIPSGSSRRERRHG